MNVSVVLHRLYPQGYIWRHVSGPVQQGRRHHKTRRRRRQLLRYRERRMWYFRYVKFCCGSTLLTGSGMLVVFSVNGNLVNTISDGGSFGELALIYGYVNSVIEFVRNERLSMIISVVNFVLQNAQSCFHFGSFWQCSSLRTRSRHVQKNPDGQHDEEAENLRGIPQQCSTFEKSGQMVRCVISKSKDWSDKRASVLQGDSNFSRRPRESSNVFGWRSHSVTRRKRLHCWLINLPA